MSKFNKAIEDVQKFKNMFGGILDLADALKEIPGIENYIAELEQGKNILLKGNTELASENAQLLSMVDEAKAKLAAVQKQAAVDGDAILQDKVNQGDTYIKAALLTIDQDKADAQNELKSSKLEVQKNKKAALILAEELKTQSARLVEIKKEIERIKSL